MPSLLRTDPKLKLYIITSAQVAYNKRYFDRQPKVGARQSRGPVGPCQGRLGDVMGHRVASEPSQHLPCGNLPP